MLLWVMKLGTGSEKRVECAHQPTRQQFENTNLRGEHGLGRRTTREGIAYSFVI
jgi:hypothetical protein